jgi:hypothetical protein
MREYMIHCITSTLLIWSWISLKKALETLQNNANKSTIIYKKCKLCSTTHMKASRSPCKYMRCCYFTKWKCETCIKVATDYQNSTHTKKTQTKVARRVRRESTLMSPRGGWIGETINFNFSSPKTWSDRWCWPVTGSASQESLVRPLPCTGPTGASQRTYKNNFKLILTSNTNQNWWVAL